MTCIKLVFEAFLESCRICLSSMLLWRTSNPGLFALYVLWLKGRTMLKNVTWTASRHAWMANMATLTCAQKSTCFGIRSVNPVFYLPSRLVLTFDSLYEYLRNNMRYNCSTTEVSVEWSEASCHKQKLYFICYLSLPHPLQMKTHPLECARGNTNKNIPFFIYNLYFCYDEHVPAQTL